MISITRLFFATAGSGDALRYAPAGGVPRPVVVWNVTRRCNLRCVHCYAEAGEAEDPAALDFEEGRAFLDDLAGFGVPAVLFSGGEPLLHPRLFDWLDHAAARGLRCALSTNGTAIDRTAARRLRAAGVVYAGISLDGLAETNDRFRGRAGAFDDALRGFRACREAGVRAGLRFTLTRANTGEIPALFDLVAEEGISRVCFYHLVPSGRADALADGRLDPASARRAVDAILEGARRFRSEGREVELLTVDNHADGLYLLGKLAAEDPAAAREAHALLRRNGGNASGARIACVDWAGIVYPDQFWRNRPVGDIRVRPFSETWAEPAHPLLAQLRDRKPLLKGRCATCGWLALCNGNLRARAEALTGDPWASDPGCYLSDEEIHPDRAGVFRDDA